MNAAVSWKLPNFTPELLWNLGYVFLLLIGVLFFGIFLLRRERLRQGHENFVGRQELLPMIEDFLYYPHQDSAEADMEYVRMKISLRELVKIPAKRKLVSQILMELRKDVSGTPRTRLQNLYMDLGLHSDAFKKLQSRRWARVAKGIEELMDMQVALAYYIVKKYINHGNSVVRKQAQLAIISLRDEGLEYFMDMASGPVSEWQQMGIMEVLGRKEDFKPPFFAKWLHGTNEDILLLVLRLISAYEQRESARQVNPLLAHPNREIRLAALECIGKCRPEGVKSPLMDALPQGATVEERVQILDALAPLLTPSDSPWLEKHIDTEPAPLVKNKLISLKEALRQGLPEEEDRATTIQPPRALPAHEPPKALPCATEDPGGSQSGRGTPAVPAGDHSDEDPDKSPALPRFAPDFSLVDLKEALQLTAAAPESAPGEGQTHPSGAYQPEGWSDEELVVFDQCVEEAWEELLTAYLKVTHLKSYNPPGQPHGVQTNHSSMKPFEPTPDWLAKIEVTGEELIPGNGYTGLLEEILLRDLEENALVFKTDFIPRIVDQDTVAPDLEPAPEAREAEESFPIPEFQVDAAAIEQVPLASGDAGKSAEQAPDAEGEAGNFSILEEYFRHYDNESKVIMLGEIPEIGEEKDLAFLLKLFEDPDKKVRAGAKKAHALLRERLGLEADPAAPADETGLWEPQTLEEPAQASGYPDSGREGEEPRLDFFPDFEADPGAALAEEPVREDTSINGYLSRRRDRKTRRNKTIDG